MQPSRSVSNEIESEALRYWFVYLWFFFYIQHTAYSVIPIVLSDFFERTFNQTGLYTFNDWLNSCNRSSKQWSSNIECYHFSVQFETLKSLETSSLVQPNNKNDQEFSQRVLFFWYATHQTMETTNNPKKLQQKQQLLRLWKTMSKQEQELCYQSVSIIPVCLDILHRSSHQKFFSRVHTNLQLLNKLQCSFIPLIPTLPFDCLV